MLENTPKHFMIISYNFVLNILTYENNYKIFSIRHHVLYLLINLDLKFNSYKCVRGLKNKVDK
jgi:hypothetical protein